MHRNSKPKHRGKLIYKSKGNFQNYVFFEEYSVAPSPSRDFYGVKLGATNIGIHHWRVTHGPLKQPTFRQLKFKDYLEDITLQNEIQRVFGKTTSETLLKFAEVRGASLELLPHHLIERIASYLGYKDICRLSLVSQRLSFSLKSDAIWKPIFLATFKDLATEEDMKLAKKGGFKVWCKKVAMSLKNRFKEDNSVKIMSDINGLKLDYEDNDICLPHKQRELPNSYMTADYGKSIFTRCNFETQRTVEQNSYKRNDLSNLLTTSSFKSPQLNSVKYSSTSILDPTFINRVQSKESLTQTTSRNISGKNNKMFNSKEEKPKMEYMKRSYKTYELDLLEASGSLKVLKSDIEEETKSVEGRGRLPVVPINIPVNPTPTPEPPIEIRPNLLETKCAPIKYPSLPPKKSDQENEAVKTTPLTYQTIFRKRDKLINVDVAPDMYLPPENRQKKLEKQVKKEEPISKYFLSERDFKKINSQRSNSSRFKSMTDEQMKLRTKEEIRSNVDKIVDADLDNTTEVLNAFSDSERLLAKRVPKQADPRGKSLLTQIQDNVEPLSGKDMNNDLEGYSAVRHDKCLANLDCVFIPQELNGKSDKAFAPDNIADSQMDESTYCTEYVRESSDDKRNLTNLIKKVKFQDVTDDFEDKNPLGKRQRRFSKEMARIKKSADMFMAEFGIFGETGSGDTPIKSKSRNNLLEEVFKLKKVSDTCPKVKISSLTDFNQKIKIPDTKKSAPVNKVTSKVVDTSVSKCRPLRESASKPKKFVTGLNRDSSLIDKHQSAPELNINQKNKKESAKERNLPKNNPVTKSTVDMAPLKKKDPPRIQKASSKSDEVLVDSLFEQEIKSISKDKVNKSTPATPVKPTSADDDVYSAVASASGMSSSTRRRKPIVIRKAVKRSNATSSRGVPKVVSVKKM